MMEFRSGVVKLIVEFAPLLNAVDTIKFCCKHIFYKVYPNKPLYILSSFKDTFLVEQI